MLMLILYLLQVCVSFYLLQEAWRFDYDLTLGSAILFGILSLVPLCLIPAFIIYIVEWSSHGERKPIVILKRKDSNG